MRESARVDTGEMLEIGGSRHDRAQDRLAGG